MKKIMIPALTLCMLVAVFAFKKNKLPIDRSSFGSGPSANGQGALVPIGATDNQQFAFHANTDKNGAVSGSWESHSPGQNVDTHGDITCLTVLPDGKTAFMTGVVTQVNADNPFGIVVGTPIWFKVQDNGEGSKAAEDLFSDYYFGVGTCANFTPALRPILNGNFQVKP
jgi:hypothetical protein